MAVIPIDAYTVQVSRSTSSPATRLTLTGPVLSHGIQNRATLFFSPSFAALSGWAINVGGLNYDGIHVYAMVPLADFDRMYDLLRNEAPVQLAYFYASSSTTTKPLTSVALRTGNEQPGEGPDDADAIEASLHAMLKARTLDLVP